MQLGLTRPLQRLLHLAVLYGEPVSRTLCWDLHCITLHSRRVVAFLNRAWNAVLAADLVVDQSLQRQPMLNSAVNSQPCRCAGFEGTDSPLAFLQRCFAKE